jgi:hypothetical protein
MKESERVMNERRLGMVPAQMADDPAAEADRPATFNDRVGVGSGDENVAKIQLATRWSEQYAPETGDTLEQALRRFRRAYNYVDAVTKFTEPDNA